MNFALVAAPTQPLVQNLRNRTERRVRVRVLACAFAPKVRGAFDAPAELLDQARFADFRLSDHQHKLAVTFAGPEPAA